MDALDDLVERLRARGKIEPWLQEAIDETRANIKSAFTPPRGDDARPKFNPWEEDPWMTDEEMRAYWDGVAMAQRICSPCDETHAEIREDRSSENGAASGDTLAAPDESVPTQEPGPRNR